MNTLPTEACVRAAFIEQSKICARLNAPFTGKICRLLAERLSSDTPFGRRVLGWRGSPGPWSDALPLRVAGALHALARRSDHPLRDIYPPRARPSANRLWAAIEQAAETDFTHLAAWLAHPPQTNEVGRSSALIAGLLEFAVGLDEHIDLLELGSSAGLNLLLDRYHHRLGDVHAGDPGSTLRLEPAWQGPGPSLAPINIRNRRGVDLRPIDVRDPDARERLSSYVWAEHQDRQETLQKALQIARTTRADLSADDAAEWLNEALADTNRVSTLVFHSIAWQYFPESSKRRIKDTLEHWGARTADGTRLGWLSFEIPDGGRHSVAHLRLRVWPERSDRLLAHASPHGQSVRWFG